LTTNIAIGQNNTLTLYSDRKGLGLRTSYGMDIRYDGKSKLRVCLPEQFRGAIDGLCGDFDGQKDVNIDPNSYKVSRLFFILIIL